MRLARLALTTLALSSASCIAQKATAAQPHARSSAALAEEPRAAVSVLPITRVALYKNGVGFFEHAGRVTGDQSVTIDFTSPQLNDVLQSLTAIDLNGGRISGAGYNSATPLEQQLKALPLTLSEDPSDVDFYNAIRGARVQLSQAGAPSFTGRLLSIGLRATSSPDHRFVTVISDTGQTRTVELTPAVSVTLLDPALHTDVSRYLELLASNRSQGLRHLTLLDRGTGVRDLRVSYISEVPVWKSTYRILFSATGSDAKSAAAPTATVQGWSVVDNTTGTDWTNVHLDLIAGAPQSFIQPLSIPYYNRRPQIGLPAEAQFAPQTHDSGDLAVTSGARIEGSVTDPSGAVIANAQITVSNLATGAQSIRNSASDGRFSVPVGESGQYTVTISMPGFQTYQLHNLAVGSQPAHINALLNVGSSSETVSVTADRLSLETSSASVVAKQRVRSAALANRNFNGMAGGVAGGLISPPPPVADYAIAAQASIAPQTSNSAFDDFFEYSITDPITIRKNESALVPILQARLPIERVTLWSTQHPQPLRALWLTNASQLTLDRGSFSIVENGSFGGEGLLDPIHPGEKRLLSYAADQAVHIDTSSAPQQSHLRSIVIANGILTQQHREVVTRVYTLRNAAPEARTVILEHARLGDHQIHADTSLSIPGQPDQPLQPEESLPNAYRFRIPVPAGVTLHLKVAESRTFPTTIAINTINDQQIRVLVQESGSAHQPDLLGRLQPILDAQRQVAALQNQLAALESKLDGLDSEEERQRSNITTLKDADKTAQKRFVDQLGHIEDQILDLQKQQSGLNAQLEIARQDLNTKVQTVQFSETLEP